MIGLAATGFGSVLVTAGAAIALVTRFKLDGPSLSSYDRDFPVTVDTDPDSPGAQRVAAYLEENFIKPAAGDGSRQEKLHAKRARFDAAGARRSFPDCRFLDATAHIGDHQVGGEWVIPTGADTGRRFLYIHGGANTVGSALSHRAITTNIARRAGAVVFAVNYRLMPEHTRMDGIDDCRLAYRWMLDNGPEGSGAATAIAVGGDSAGGNLTLSLINWVRDEGLRAADAVVAISPATDATCKSPSLRENFDTDLMLKPLVAPMLKIPRAVLLWLFWSAWKIAPSSPLVSPIYADLSRLPPTLVHISAHEMLYDDARRYVAKAQDAGSPARLQSWAHMAHVWHMFDDMLPEAVDALDEIGAFLRETDFAA